MPPRSGENNLESLGILTINSVFPIFKIMPRARRAPTNDENDEFHEWFYIRVIRCNLCYSVKKQLIKETGDGKDRKC